MHRVDEALLVGEDPEDRSLGDPGGLGDLARRDRGAMGEQEGKRRRDDLGPSLRRGEGGRSGAAGHRGIRCGRGRRSGGHPSIIHE